MDKSKIIFMHIPKTAGTTFRRIMDNQYEGSEIYRTYRNMASPKIQNFKDIKCIQGHDYYGTHKNEDHSFQYVTFLRDPVERVISEYYYLCRTPKHDPYVGRRIVNQKLTLEDYINSEDKRFIYRTSNLQTRYCAGGTLNLEQAKHNLSQFTVIGLTERFNDSMKICRKEFGWNVTGQYSYFLVSKNRPRSYDIPPHIIEKIKERNKLDIILYNYGKILFEEKLKHLND